MALNSPAAAGSPRQLTLGVGRNPRMRFANYVTGRNGVAVAAVQAAAEGRADTVCYLWGAAASGRSHLLQAGCAEAAASGAAAAYLPLGAPEVRPPMLEGLEEAALVCVDDVHRVAGDAAFEEALFHLYNRVERARDAGRPRALVVAGDAPPARLALALEDLRSRLAAGVTCQLRPLDDAGLSDALKRGARERGFELSDEVAGFLLKRERRETAHLMAVLDTLDRGSLEAKRRLTVAFVRDLLRARP